MSTHVIAFQQSVDQATIGNINAVTDSVLSPSGTTGLFVPNPPYDHLHWAYSGGASVTRAQVVTPSLGVRRMSLEVVPGNRSVEAQPVTGPRVFVPTAPIPLVSGEVINAQMAEDGAGASQMTMLLGLGPASLPALPNGDIRAIRATGTTTLAVRAWTQVTLTPDVTIEAGTYVVVGLVPISANCVAARLVLEGGGFRPGNLGLAQTAGNPPDGDITRLLRPPFFGFPHGTFRSTAFPAVEFFATVADTAETVYLYVIRVGDLRGA